MNQNITLFVGDNAQGKTRKLKQIIERSWEKKLEVVTNMPEYYSREMIEVDEKKLNLLVNSENNLWNMLNDNELRNEVYKEHVQNMFSMICSRGDILILDEVDAMLRLEDKARFGRAIGSVRSLWKEIYVTAHDFLIDTMFIDHNDELDDIAYTPNIYLVNRDLSVIQMTEDEAIEYIDEI